MMNNGNAGWDPRQPPVRQAVLYARVSSKEQDREGYSIPAQLKLLQDYALKAGFAVAREYVDIETAKTTGRAGFSGMVAYLRQHSCVRVVLAEKTDRLYRNLRDWVTFDELGMEIHLPKEGVVLSRDSRSAEKLMHGIRVVMAKNYIDNLSEEARKGQLEKAAQGHWPTRAPIGYRNVTRPDGRKVIAPDPELAPLVTKLFNWYATGHYALGEITTRARAEGLVYRRSGNRVPVSTVHSVLRNRIYTGEFDWKGTRYQGQHVPLVPVELWERVQAVLDSRSSRKPKRSKHNFAFSGLISCSRCGCAIVGEMKKQKYIYYHCTGYAEKCTGNPASCRRKHVREEVLEDQFAQVLGRLRFDDEVLDWARLALQASHAEEQQEHQAAISRLDAECTRLGERIDAMYIDKLDGRIDGAFFDRKSAEWRAAQNRCLREIAHHQQAGPSYIHEGVALLDLARNAQRLFERQEAREKRRLLNFVLSNCTWDDGVIDVVLRQPYDLLAETTDVATRSDTESGVNPNKSEIWLGW
ncbi:MAG: recombinase family protein [Rhodobacteraceae bacterium]|nr:recombinase family protein [Paracoccaceae bacterium]